MKKLILGSLLILGIPQVLVSLFFLFVKTVVGWGPNVGLAYVIVAGILLLISSIVASACVFDFEGSGGWLREYIEEQQRLESQREKLRQKLEEEIGIPRIK